MGKIVQSRSALLASSVLAGVLHALPFFYLGTVTACVLGFAFCLYLSAHLFCFKRMSVLGGLLIGSVFNLLAFSWLPETIERFTGYPPLACALLFILFALCSSLPFVTFAIIYDVFLSKHRTISLLGLPCAWTLAEILIPRLSKGTIGDTQFAWNLVAQVADLGGTSLITFLLLLWTNAIVFIFCSFVTESKTRDVNNRSLRFAVLTSVVLLSLVLGYGVFRTRQVERIEAAAPKLTVAVIQPNYAPEKHYSEEFAQENIKLARNLSFPLVTEYQLDLLIWPESSVLRTYDVEQNWITRGLDEDPFPGLPVPLLFGTQSSRILARGNEARYNTAMLLQPAGEVRGIYLKTHLFPFSEVMPGESLIPGFLRRYLPRVETPLVAGDKDQKPILLRDDVRLDIDICYDDLFLTRNCESDEVGSVLVTLSNDSWFGPTLAPRQHHYLAAWKALESRRHMLRVTVNGVSGWIGPTGKELDQIAPKIPAARVYEGIGVLGITSFYGCYGPSPFAAVVVLLLCLGMFRPRK